MDLKKNIESFYPLSPMQQGMLFHTLYDDGAGLYIEQMTCELEGDLDSRAFQAAWQQTLDRHSALRTGFVWEGIKEPVQVVHRRVDLAIEQRDWRDIPVTAHERRLAAFLDAERARGFALAQPPLMRLALLRIADRRYYFVWTHHHIVMDGWSVPLVFNEAFAGYDLRLRGQALTPPPARPYRDYITWIQRQPLGEAEAFWRRSLRGFIAPTPLVADRTPHADSGAMAFAERARDLTLAETEALQALTRRHHLTMNTLVQGAWAIVLSRYSREPDVIFGATVSGRPHDLPGVERMIGLFINTLPVRIQVAPDTPLLDWLKQIQAQQAELRQYEYSPLVQIQGWSDVPRGLPLFESLVVFENYPVGNAEAEPGPGEGPSLKVRALPGIERTNYPITVIAGLGRTLELRICYDRRRFDAPTIERMLERLRLLLHAMVATPAGRLADQPYLTAAERAQALAEWNDTTRAYSLDQPLHALIAAQAARSPDAVALSFADAGRGTQNEAADSSAARGAEPTHLSYAALDRRANQLANHLRALGAGPESRVGICADRSLELVIGLLGILKAGSAYVPLDPSYPRERLAYMLEDSQAQIILTKDEGRATNTGVRSQKSEVRSQALRADGLSADEAVREPTSSFVDLSADWPQIAQLPADPPARRAEPENLAYVIYTSGSTGRPKGAMNTHRSIVNRLLWMQESYQLAADDRVLQKTPMSFDVSVWEFFWPLIVGAQLVLAQPGGHQDSAYMAETIRAARITTIHFVPSMLVAFLEHPQAGACATLRRVICSGEALPADLAQRYFQRLSAGLHNLYGPTEAAVDVTAWDCNPADASAVPIGHPIANTQIYLLDQRMDPVPIGVAGELHIGGVQLARGYLDRPDLTADRFIPNPFSKGSGVRGQGSGRKMRDPDPRPPTPDPRLYRTGDLARFRPDGAIEYLGRIDHQIKLRGVRIELGEIEAALHAHPSVRDAAAIVREDAPGDRRIVAYIVQGSAVSGQGPGGAASDDLTPDPRSLIPDLREWLGERLPSAMIPSQFVTLDALPLTPSGKLDRRALPAPDATRPLIDTLFIAPTNPTEEVLAQIWADVLRLERVGVRDNFFDLGGHSLLATQIVSRVRETFQVELPLRSVFEAPRVADLAERIIGMQRAAQRFAIPPLAPAPRDRPLPLSFAQQRLWFLDQLQPNSAAYNMPAALRLHGAIGLAAFGRSLDGVVRRHEGLRTTFAAGDGQPVQLIARRGAARLRLLDLRGLDGAEDAARRLAQAEADRPFDLTRGPLLRVALLRLAADEHILLLTIHHIVTDAWSMDLFMGELMTLYHGFAAGAPATLPDLPLQYADYAVWQRGWLQGELLDAQLAYWRRQLAGLPILQLPTDHARPATPSQRGALQPFALPRPLSEALAAIARRRGVTMFMALLALWQMLLARYSGQNDLAVGSPIANRTRAETERMIGFFVNMLVLRADLSGRPTFYDLLRRAREVCLGAYAHQDLPFEQVVEAIQPARDPSRHPLFQVMFALQNAPREAIELHGLTLRPLEIEQETAKFDLSLSISDAGSELFGMLQYDAALFDAPTIARMARHLQTLAEGAAAGPDRPVADLAILTDAERIELLVDWNDTRSDYPRERCIHELFAERARATPDAVAATYETQHLTYGELDARSNRLARHLRTLGAGAETLVGLCMQRSLDLPIGMLGILKAGAAYVPLDPAYPAARLSFMLEDTRTPALITQDRLAGALPHQHAAKIVRIDADWPQIAAHSALPPASRATSDQLAYVMYTSGSTGGPKGVSVTHRSVVRLVRETNYVNLDAGQVFLQLAPISFDAATFEVWGSLLNGARLVLFPAHMPSLDELGRALERFRVTTLWLTAGLFHEMVDRQLDRLRGVRQLLAGGDVLSVAHVRRALDRLGGCTLINGYGPTENTTFTCCHPMTDADAAGASVPIGRPIANTQAYILDRRMEPVPAGVPGELVIGGSGLARGYLGRPDLTAAAFLPNPFTKGSEVRDQGSDADPRSPIPDPRLYRTGDLARFRADGVIEFLGRFDTQVKLRGFRIELGEIETALNHYPPVRNCFVMMREDAPGDRRIIAYVVPNDEPDVRDDSAPSLGAGMWAWIRSQLPDYMLPSAIVLLDALPLTPNGKVDRRALPAPEQTAADAQSDYKEPRDSIEFKLALIWEDLLNTRPISILDNFFYLGGHSVLALRLIARIEQEFGQALPLAALFSGPTIEQIACRLRDQTADAPWSPLVAIQPSGSDAPLFLVHPAGGTAFCYTKLAQYLGPNQPVYGLQARGSENDQDPLTSIEEMAACYIEALRTVQPRGPYRLGGWSSGGLIAFEMAQQLRRQDEEIALLGLLDTWLPQPDSTFTPPDDAERLARFIGKENLPMPYEEFRLLASEDQWALAVEMGRKSNFLPPDTGVRELRRTMNLFRANMRAAMNYAPQIYPGRITLFKAAISAGDDDPSAPEQASQTLADMERADPTRGWGALSDQPVEVHAVAGTHPTMVFEPYVKDLAQRLKSCLEPYELMVR